MLLNLQMFNIIIPKFLHSFETQLSTSMGTSICVEELQCIGMYIFIYIKTKI